MRNHFFFARVGVLGEQGGRLHDLAGLAVAALRNLLGDPRLLQRMVALGAEAFDGGDLLAGDVAERSLAGSHGLAVDVNRTGAAQAGAAAEFRAGHLQLFADGPEQRRIGSRLDGHIPSVDVESWHGFFPCRCMTPLTAAPHIGLWSDTHRVDADLGRKNDRVPTWRQSKLEENKFAKSTLCVAATNFVIKLSLDRCPRRTEAMMSACLRGISPRRMDRARIGSPKFFGQPPGNRNAKDQSGRGRDLL